MVEHRGSLWVRYVPELGMFWSGLNVEGGEESDEKCCQLWCVFGEGAVADEEFIVMMVLVSRVAALQAVVPGGVISVWWGLPGCLVCLGANLAP